MSEEKSNFILSLINKDRSEGKHDGIVHTRFPPEPNGWLHIGHAKAILLNYTIAESFGGKFNLRFDDTNPIKEEQEFVDSILNDIRWLGADWEDRLFFASDYFEVKYEYARRLIQAGRAYVCDLTPEQIREYRGTLTEPGKESPYRNRPAAENLDLFERMKQGEFPDGSRVLRAKIDMASGNLNMRDPVLYRILHAHHHRTGDKWCIYPMYDFDHPFSDAYEGITHSLCSIEYSDHRPLYDWVVDNAVELAPEHVARRSNQYEFARLNITYTVMSKRKLRRLVEEGFVEGWDDPRMPTVAGLRRRGVTSRAVRDFCDRIGVARGDSTVDLAMLEHCIREDLSESPRMMAVLEPIKLVITNWPEDKVEWLEAENLPGDEAAGKRKMPFGREIYIDRDDFMEEPVSKFHRLAPGKEVRLKGAYVIECQEVIKDAEGGKITELRCTYDPVTRSGQDTSGKKVKGVIHWVSAAHGVPASVRLYENLFLKENPEDGEDFTENINPDSLQQITAIVEPALAEAEPGSCFQFMRLGYFYRDPQAKGLVFNRTVSLRDTWAKLNK